MLSPLIVKRDMSSALQVMQVLQEVLPKFTPSRCTTTFYGQAYVQPLTQQRTVN